MKNKIIRTIVCDARLGIDTILEEDELYFNQKLKKLILEYSIIKEDEGYCFKGQRNKPDEMLRINILKYDDKWIATICKGIDLSGPIFDSNRFKFLLKTRLYSKFKRYIFDNYDLSKEGELRNKRLYNKEISSKQYLKVV